MITLFQHQQQALDLTEGHNRCAYYLDMGLGKTFVGSEKALTLNSRVNLLICQCSKVSDWIDHMVENYAMNHCWMIYDLTNKKEFDWFMAAVAETDNPTRICGVINYELTFRRKILKTLSGFTLMLDESSLIQNENAKRSKFILGLNPDNVILLSGTPTGGKYGGGTETLVLEPIGADFYNQAITGGVTMTLAAARPDHHHLPCALIPYTLKIRSGCEGG